MNQIRTRTRHILLFSCTLWDRWCQICAVVFWPRPLGHLSRKLCHTKARRPKLKICLEKNNLFIKKKKINFLLH